MGASIKLPAITTQMAIVFGKRPSYWLKTTEVQDYLRTISVMKKIVTADLEEVRQGSIGETVFAEPISGVGPMISNFITKEYFLAMKSYYEWRKQCRQLELPLDFGGEEGTL